MLDNILHRYSSNLVVQYWLQVEKEDTVMRLLIDNKIAKYLGCTEEYLYYHACKNIGTPVVKNIIDISDISKLYHEYLRIKRKMTSKAIIKGGFEYGYKF